MSLVEISFESLPALRDKFLVDWPTHIVAFSLLDNYIKRYFNFPSERGTFFSLNSEWRSDGTFLAILRERNLMFATLDDSLKNLKTALKLFPFGRQTTFLMSVRDIYYSTVQEVIAERRLNVSFDYGTVLNYMSKENAKKLNIELPGNFQLRPLEREHADKITSVSPNRSDICSIEYMIDHTSNVGLFDANDELVAWCLQYIHFWSMALLQVDERHLRKGFGQIVASAISRKIAMDSEADVTANVVHDNLKSLNLFAKLGFVEIDCNHWMGVNKIE